MRRGVRGDLAHRIACARCCERQSRWRNTRRTLTAAERRVLETADDRHVLQDKARAYVLGDVPWAPWERGR